MNEHRAKNHVASAIVAGALIVALTSLMGLGCWGGDDESPTSTSIGAPGVPSTTTTTVPEEVADPIAAYSTFRSKDPFIPQMGGDISPGTTLDGGQPPATTIVPGTSPTSPAATVRPTTTTAVPSTPTTHSGGTTTTAAPTTTTSTTAPHLHTLKVLSVGQVAGASAVTLQVDTSVYKDRRIGSVISTSWGQIKVLDINTSSKVVTLLHGSETLNLIVGQVIYE